MRQNRRKTGSDYEQIAGQYIEAMGAQILNYNYYCRHGEIDIIAKDGDYLVFCEVKYRRDTRMGLPTEAVNTSKQRRISKCAMYYLTVHGLLYMNIRFDVIGIMNDKIEWIRDAFEYIG